MADHKFERNSYSLRLSLEEATMFASGDWRRKVDYTEEIPIPEQEWDDYCDALDDLRSLQSRECWIGYDGDEEYIEKPRPRTIYHYAETEEEWEARVRAKLDAGEQPDNWIRESFVPAASMAGLLYEPSPLMEMQDRINATHAKVNGLGGAVDYYTFRQPEPAGWTTEDQRASRGGTFAPNAQVVASHIRKQINLDVFNKECRHGDHQ